MTFGDTSILCFSVSTIPVHDDSYVSRNSAGIYAALTLHTVFTVQVCPYLNLFFSKNFRRINNDGRQTVTRGLPIIFEGFNRAMGAITTVPGILHCHPNSYPQAQK
jgi:hypothetical protein